MSYARLCWLPATYVNTHKLLVLHQTRVVFLWYISCCTLSNVSCVPHRNVCCVTHQLCVLCDPSAVFFFREYIPVQEYLIIIGKKWGNTKLRDWGKRWSGYSRKGMGKLLGGWLAFPTVTVKLP